MTKENPHYMTPSEAEEKRCVSAPDVWYCKGPECMAWRWKELIGWEEGGNLEVKWSKTHGYCGMVQS